MSLAITCTPDTANALISLSVSGLGTMDTFTITRTMPSGAIVNCREATSVPTGGSLTWTGVDHDAPLGVSLTYTINAQQHDGTGAVVATATASTTATISVPAGTYWLKDFSQPAMNMKVRVVDVEDVTRPARQQVYVVVGRANPVVISDVRGGRIGKIIFDAYDATTNTSLKALLSTGRPLLFQATPESGWDDLVFSAGEVVSHRMGAGSALTRIISVAFTEVDTPSGLTTALPANSWLAVQGWATWSDLMAARATWLDVINRPYGS